jgi:transcriptional regulator with XRE-family HTH domain
VNHTGRQLRELRQMAGLSQQELGRRAGVSQTSISKIEKTGKVRARLSTLRLLAEGLTGAPSLSIFDLEERGPVVVPKLIAQGASCHG